MHNSKYSTLTKEKNGCVILRSAIEKNMRYFYRYRRTLFMIAIVVAVTVISNTLIMIFLSRSHGVKILSIGTIDVSEVEAYGGNVEFINGVASIDWGTLKFGDSKTVSFYLRSTINTPARLAFNVTDWNPEGIKEYVALSWNYNETKLEPKQEILISFKLSTSDTRDFANYIITNDVQSYSFNIYIYTQK